ncbi:MAG: DUF87 domain-containing protein [Bacteroidaceae bacterium]|nr:DUF87 domain-containing protein [Bacteroidaceae bacterium]
MEYYEITPLDPRILSELLRRKMQNDCEPSMYVRPQSVELSIDDFYFVKIRSISFTDKAPRKEAVENILSTMRIPNVNFVYLIKGDEQKVTFYYGVSHNLYTKVNESRNISESVLKKAITGNFRGSVIEDVNREEKEGILRKLENYKFVNTLEGVPGLNDDESEQFQRVDRLVDTMLGDDFVFLVTAKSISIEGVEQIEKGLFSFYDQLLPHSKRSEQVGHTVGTSESEQLGKTKGSSKAVGNTIQQSEAKTISESGETTSGQTTHTKTEILPVKQLSDSESKSTSKSTSSSHSDSITREHSNREVQDWIKYVDETLIKRLDYGKGKGIFVTAITLFADSRVVLQKLANTATSLFSGEEGNKVPLVSREITENVHRNLLHKLQIPIIKYETDLKKVDKDNKLAHSQYTTTQRAYVGSWYSVNELGVITGLPCKEVVGLSLKEEVDFGLNFEMPSEDNMLSIGCLVQSGIKHENIPVAIDKNDLNKHIFVCGVTGSGKTTTCMNLLENSQMPFMVIEPAKTEYRILSKYYPDLLVFTLGNDNVAPFRLNPLEFLPTESISSHVDMLMASIEAAFDMEAAIPQIIEKGLYLSYEKFGWNTSTNSNSKFKDPFADGVFSFPTLSDLITNIETVVKEQGFDDRLKNDYLGSIRARLMGLTVGSKGAMLNTKRSISVNDLIHRRVVLELEEVKSGREKSLVMGFVLSNLCESIKAEYKKNRSFKHITLVEEAHRLLSKYTPGDSLSKKNGVETFADMLAEVRKYGESLIIADQIPNKMTPDVLKNTNTKIVHKIFAQDDKEAIGDCMSLTKEQKSFLSNLEVGRAVVFNQNWDRSILVQIKQGRNTSDEYIEEEELTQKVLGYYAQNYRLGVIPGLTYISGIPTIDVVKLVIREEISPNDIYKLLNSKSGDIPDRIKALKVEIETLKQREKSVNLEILASYYNIRCYREPNDKSARMLKELLSEIYNDNVASNFRVKYNVLFEKNKNKF